MEPLQSQVMELALTNSSLDFVSLVLARGFDLVGTVVGVPASEISILAVRTESDVGQWLRRSAPVAADGSFQIKGVQEGQYEVELSSMPAGAYVKSLRLGDTEAS